MTPEEAIKEFESELKWAELNTYPYVSKQKVEADKIAIKALEREPEIEQFAKWVAEEIFDDMWEYNKDAFAEIACRKLAKLDVVIRMGDEWILVESRESEEL